MNFPDSTSRAITGFTSPQTVLMNAAKTHARPLAFSATGAGESTLLHSIDDVTNEGGNGRAWQYWIDGTYGMASIGAAKVAAGQRVSWAFRPYDRDPKPPPP